VPGLGHVHLFFMIRFNEILRNIYCERWFYLSLLSVLFYLYFRVSMGYLVTLMSSGAVDYFRI